MRKLFLFTFFLAGAILTCLLLIPSRAYADPLPCGDVNQGCCTPGNTCLDNLTCKNDICVYDNSEFLCDSNGNSGIKTAIGCVPASDMNAFLAFILKWAIGIGGGIAFLLILYGGFMVTTSSGIPDRIKAGQELITSAIAGLIMIIFSVFILEYIGVRILNIPGFI